MNDAINSLVRGITLGLLIITFIKVKHIERTMDVMAKAMQVEVVK